MKLTRYGSDELTPRHDWTYQGPNHRAAIAIRDHCARNCRCNSEATNSTERETTTIYTRGGTVSISRKADGSVWAHYVAFEQRVKAVFHQVLPPQTHGSYAGSNPSGLCGPERNKFCPSRWPTRFLGPIPLQDNAAVPPGMQSRASIQSNLTVWGNECRSDADCNNPAAAAEGEKCFCTTPSPATSRALGLDPLFPATLCLAYAAKLFTSRPN